jgi:hypothetical protein
MNSRLNSKLLGVPIIIWIAQFLYVAAGLLLLIILLSAFNTSAVPRSSYQLFSVIYVVVMIAADIAWRLAVTKGRTVIAIITIAMSIVVNIAIAQYFVLQSAHSSFENYYNFRGCSTLVSKSTDSGTCKLSSGETIKIVEYQNKWYLDGDLPSGLFSL